MNSLCKLLFFVIASTHFAFSFNLTNGETIFNDLESLGFGEYTITGEDPYFVFHVNGSGMLSSSSLVISTNRYAILHDFGVIKVYFQQSGEAFNEAYSVVVYSSPRYNQKNWHFVVPIGSTLKKLNLDAGSVSAIRVDLDGKIGATIQFDEMKVVESSEVVEKLRSYIDFNEFSPVSGGRLILNRFFDTLEYLVHVFIIWFIFVLPSIVLASKWNKSSTAYSALLIFLVVIPLLGFLIFDLHKLLLVPKSGPFESFRILYHLLPLFALAQRGVRHRLKPFIQSNRLSLLSFHLLVIVSLVLAVYSSRRPAEYFSFIEIAHKKVFSATIAHDNAFQYYNSIALGTEEGFDAYYGERRLTYGVNDRQILPGILNSSVNKALQSFSYTNGYRFSLYVAYSAFLNAVFVFPLCLFVNKFIKNNHAWVLFLITSHLFIVCNLYYTWFKMSGAGFFLLGTYLLLYEKRSIQSWMICGLLWGIAANMHSSVVLVYPLIFLLVYCSRSIYKLRWRNQIGYLGVTIIVITAIMPWSIVRKAVYNDKDSMPRQFLISGWAPEDGEYPGFLKTMIAYFEQTTFEDELNFRIETLTSSLTIGRFGELLSRGLNEGWGTFLYLYAKYEVQFWGFIFLPSLVLQLMFYLYSGVFQGRIDVTARNRATLVFLITSFFAYFIILLGRDNSQMYFAYYNWHIPFALIIVLLLSNFMMIDTFKASYSRAILVTLAVLHVTRLIFTYAIQESHYERFLLEELRGLH